MAQMKRQSDSLVVTINSALRFCALCVREDERENEARLQLHEFSCRGISIMTVKPPEERFVISNRAEVP